MKIQLFNPPVHHYAGVWYRMNPGLGLPILAAALHEAGHQVQVYDLEALGVTPQQLAKQFDAQRKRWPDAIGFTETHHNRRGVRECITALRGIGYEGYVMVGGPEATLNPEEPLDWGADAVAVGETEGNVAELFEMQPAGIVAGRSADISAIPGPLWSVHHPAPTQYYGNLPDVGKPEGIAMWSRGCPHNCTFCGNPVYGHSRIRRRPATAICADMAALKELGCKAVFVYDDEIPGAVGGDDWLEEVCARIAPLGLTWKCQGRCTERLERETLQAMYDAGCRAVMWGVESFSDKVLEDMSKHTTSADIWHTLRLAHDVGIGNWLFLMVGNYRETMADLEHTEAELGKAVREGLVQWRQVTVTTPVPGTELYETAKAEGWLVEPPEVGPQMNQVYQRTPWLSEREITHWKARLETIA